MNDENEQEAEWLAAEKLKDEVADRYTLSEEAETYIVKHEKRVEQGLGNYPHGDSGPQFVRLGDDGKP